MPIDNPDLCGTEKDGTKSNEYCRYCYQNGEFTNPDLTLEEMKEHMMRIMEKDKLSKDILERALNRLPFLKRWSSKVTLL
jgi:predicted nucleic acid-binding protein